MKKLLIMGLMLFAGISHAQDVFQEVLFSAELVFQNSFTISLTDQQADKINKIHSQNSMEFRKVKWDLDEASVKLRKLLKETRINSKAVSKQLDIILGLENSLKKNQLLKLVAIKNELSETQQKALQELKEINNLMTMAIAPGIESKTKTNGNSNPNVKYRLSADSENSPLMLMSTKDGMVKIENIDKINPEDIQSLEVLKDKFLIDKYGEKAKNGVVIITLKKDKE